jgi:RsiW-degrading membrane proteinase PrsW (M82 family)
VNIYAAITLCFVPYFILFAVCRFAMQVKIGYELFASLLGLIAVLPITFLQFYVINFPFFNAGTYSAELLKALIMNGLIEEVIKMTVLLLLPAKKMDSAKFFACALLCGLCLGCFESTVYFLQHLQRANAAGAKLLYEQIFARMFTADMLHLCCTGLTGLFIWTCRRKRAMVSTLIYAVVIHGIYNFFSLFTTNVRWFALAALLFAAVECRTCYIHIRDAELAGMGKSDP